ncbi:MAG: peptidoglycan bridge formation glycyltransferase FemA/FemB family protein, partial [Anaerolineales bacterium]|nr:peptidoglycan bridge formation glycyltransferase FemA/FemB family protein [Anaerolineales bacterium]
MADMFELGEQDYSDEDAAWDHFVTAHPHGSILQTTPWARLKSRFGWVPKRVWAKKDGRIVAGAQMLIRSAALGTARMGYVPHGPLLNWDDPEQVEVLFNQINLAAYQSRAGFVKVEPLLWQDAFGQARWQTLCESLSHGRVQVHNPTDTIQPPRTVVIDLRPSEDDILAAMKQKTRYNIRLAQRKEVTVRRGTRADIATFNLLMLT